MVFSAVEDTIVNCLENIQNNSSYDDDDDDSSAAAEVSIHKLKSLQALVNMTKVSPQNRNFVAQTDGAISSLFSLSKSSSQPTIQNLSLSILFNLSLNPNLKQSLAQEIDNIIFLNSAAASLSSTSAESTKLIAASLLCSLSMLDKNKAKFGVAGTVQALITSISDNGFRNPAFHHLLSSLAELVQYHGNCTLAVRSNAVPILIKAVKNGEEDDGEDHTGTCLTILNLLARFEEGLIGLRNMDGIVELMVQVLKGRNMFSKEGAAEILLRLFEESEECLRVGLKMNELSSLLADLSVRGSAKAKHKATCLMNKIMEAYSSHGNQVFY